MKKGKVLDALGALSHGKRLDIVRLLVPCGDTGLTAGEIGAKLNMPASGLSFHLSALEQAGLLTSHRQSRNVIYKVEHQRIGRIFSYLLNDCCGGHPKICEGTLPDTKARKPIPAPEQ